MQKSAVIPVVLACALAAPAAFSEELNCLGAYNIRQNGNELDTTNYRFRNFNNNQTLTITRITIYAFDGTVIFNLFGSAFPADFNPVLRPHQTTGLNLEDLFGNTQPPNHFVQTVVTWEGDRGRRDFDPLDATAHRVTRQRDPATRQQLETRARAVVPCTAPRLAP